jgi:hypothetical protein
MKSRLSKIIMLCGLIYLAAMLCPAQRQSLKSVLPRVGKIRNDQSRGRDVEGCDSHLLTFRKNADDLFFVSHPNGLDAWMNLDGHNVQLKLLKTTLYHLDEYGYANAVYEYRYRKINITIRLPLMTDYTTYVAAKVLLRNGRSRRSLRAFAAPQCDAI